MASSSITIALERLACGPIYDGLLLRDLFADTEEEEEDPPREERSIAAVERRRYDDGSSVQGGGSENPPIFHECDYDRGGGPHALYVAMGNRNWEEAEAILRFEEAEAEAVADDAGGYASWFNGWGWPLTKSILELGRQEDPAVVPLSRVWIKRLNKDGTIKWRVTPLHAATIFDAPIPLLRLLLKVNNDGNDNENDTVYGSSPASLVDDKGNLPLHLAFMHGLRMEKIGLLYEAYPKGAECKNREGKIPIECCSCPGVLSCIDCKLQSQRLGFERNMYEMKGRLLKEHKLKTKSLLDHLREENVRVKDETVAKVCEEHEARMRDTVERHQREMSRVEDENRREVSVLKKELMRWNDVTQLRREVDALRHDTRATTMGILDIQSGKAERREIARLRLREEQLDLARQVQEATTREYTNIQETTTATKNNFQTRRNSFAKIGGTQQWEHWSPRRIH